MLQRYQIGSGKLLDPFAGSGTALFTAGALEIDADGIELLPIGQEIIGTRLCLDKDFTTDDVKSLQRWLNQCPWENSEARQPLPELKITRGAYPEATLMAIEQYKGAMQAENIPVRTVLRFALLCVLESISYTRKDGQYLRWDYRSGRQQRTSRFDKCTILSFGQAICEKLSELLLDLSVTNRTTVPLRENQGGRITLFPGSSLYIMPKLASETYDVVFTSPPYCNRYDYTRTYALELALLGIEHQDIVRLRQEMLSCTVENRAKDLLAINSQWAEAVAATDQQEFLQAILRYLESQKEQRKLNNDGISRMVRGYFYEMACIIAECVRVMKPNARLLMVNDNVRYAGASISVDLILSRIAEQGFEVETILVLPKGKGNSSQQMGKHGRDCLRKCIYVWRKKAAISGGKSESISLTTQLKPLEGTLKATPTSNKTIDSTVTRTSPDPSAKFYRRHLSGSASLVTPYEKVRAGFVALAFREESPCYAFH